jgi:hypothetical protein
MTTYDHIQEYLKSHGKTYGGTLEREVSIAARCKPSNISRRCRELADEGVIKASYHDGVVVYEMVEGKAHKGRVRKELTSEDIIKLSIGCR